MSAPWSLPTLKARGIELWAQGETLRYRAPPGTVTPDLLAALKAHKPELLQTLSKRANLEPAAAEACVSLKGYITPAALLSKLAPEDLADLEAMPTGLAVGFLRALATACVWTDMRRQGIAPLGWDQPATCKLCGPVLLWASMDVAGCPWCWNRRLGVRIPRPQMTAPTLAGGAIPTDPPLGNREDSP